MTRSKNLSFQNIILKEIFLRKVNFYRWLHEYIYKTYILQYDFHTYLWKKYY